MDYTTKAKLVQQQTKQSNSFSLDATHVTTANFMQFKPIYYRHLIPNQGIKVNVNSFTRLNPLTVPTFGSVKQNMRAFFVPYRTVCSTWNEFITDSIMYKDGGVKFGEMWKTTYNSIINPILVLPTWNVESTSDDYDFFAYNIGTTTVYKYYKLTQAGKLLFDQLYALGYRVNWTELMWDSATQRFSINRTGDNLINALPILCLGRVYLDWYYNTMYTYSGDYLRAMGIFKDTAVSQVPELDLLAIFKIIGRPLNYDSDYFTAAWDYPTGGTQNSTQGHQVNDVGYNSEVTEYSNVTNMATLTAGNQGLSKQGLKALAAMSDWSKRKQLAGTLILDRYFAEYGIQLTNEKIERSIYLGAKESNINFGSVTSNAYTAEANLGAFAGVGVGAADGSFDYNTTEFGMFVIINSFIPRIEYGEGIDRETLKTSLMDFFNADFDALGVQGIRRDELIVPFGGNGTGVGNDAWNSREQELIFGYTPRYAEYKVPKSWITGSFLYPTTNAGMDAWHTFRKYQPTNGYSMVAHRPEFTQGTDSAQYNRMFYTSLADNFNCIFKFNVNSWAKMKPLYDTYEWEHEYDNTTSIIQQATSKLN